MNLSYKTGKISCLLVIFCWFHSVNAQICGTPGMDGTTNRSGIVNTYYPPQGSVVLLPGTKTLQLAPVPGIDSLGNHYGTIPISPGDLLLLIQMQDATINYTNDAFYGANSSTSGPDFLGGTGFTSLENTGKFEYVISTGYVPLTGGYLTFKAAGLGFGTVNTYINTPPTATRGKRTFQVVRVPQYSNLILENNIKAAPFNGDAGGVIAFDVSGTLGFSGYTIDASSTGFRSGDILPTSRYVNQQVYLAAPVPEFHAGKGEGIAGTPKYVWNNIFRVNNVFPVDGYYGLPLGSTAKGAPGNAGGGGNDFIAGGGGGGNGGPGGAGAHGITYNRPWAPRLFPNGGRPGSAVYQRAAPDPSRLIMGGGGGGSSFASIFGGIDRIGLGSGKDLGKSGGGIILMNVNYIKGKGTILSNGRGTPVDDTNLRDSIAGNGGAGAGGTILLRVKHPDLSMPLTISAKGGKGGTTMGYEVHFNLILGAGGGGGGGQVFCFMPDAPLDINVSKGKAGNTLDPNNPDLLARDGQDGNAVHYPLDNLPSCFPELSTTISLLNPVTPQYPGSLVTYQINTTNNAAAGNAGGVQLDHVIPIGLSFVSAEVTYSGDARGPSILTNTGTTQNQLRFGDFNIPPGDTVSITVTGKIDCAILPGTYHSSAIVSYLDPTRTMNNPDRRISPLLNSFDGYLTDYEAGGVVPGSNYNGNDPAATAEDLKVIAVVLQNNQIHAPEQYVFCTSGNPDQLTGELPSGGTRNFSYQWQQSRDNVIFEDIPGAISKDYDPGQLNSSVYYRRVTSHLGCSQTFTSNTVFLNVQNPLPAPDFITPDFCLNDGIAIFKNQTTISDTSSNQLSYLWDFGDAANSSPLNPNISTMKNGSHAYSQTGNYMVSLTVRKNGECPLSIQKNFKVNGSVPKAIFTVQNNKICSGDEIVFEDKATVNFGEITRIEWYYDYGNEPAAAEVDEHPESRTAAARQYKHRYPLFHSPAIKPVTVRMVVYSGISCVDEQQMNLNILAVPEVDFGPLSPVCEESPAFRLTQGKEIWGLLAGTETYSGPGVSRQGLFNPAVAGPGTHVVSYLFTADNGCSSSIKTQTITVYPKPTIDAGNDETILQDGQIQLKANATGSNLHYKWTPPTSLDRDDISNPIANPGSNITYTLTVTTDQGCSASDQVLIQVLRNPEIPNAFTPNGDNINDLWNIKYISSYPGATVNVYNRYGEKVFSSRAAQMKSWDGKYHGVDVPVGTYYYVIDPNNGRKPITGPLTILR